MIIINVFKLMIWYRGAKKLYAYQLFLYTCFKWWTLFYFSANLTADILYLRYSFIFYITSTCRFDVMIHVVSVLSLCAYFYVVDSSIQIQFLASATKVEKHHSPAQSYLKVKQARVQVLGVNTRLYRKEGAQPPSLTHLT